MKIGSVLAKGVLIAGVMSACTMAKADFAVFVGGNDVTSLLPISAVYRGTTTLTRPGLPSLTCTLELNGFIDEDGSGNGVVTVTSGSVSGFLCGIVTLSGFDWVSNAYSPADVQPISDIDSTGATVYSPGVRFNNVQVNLCNSNNPSHIYARYNNRDDGTNTLNSVPSTFEFVSAPLVQTSSNTSNCTVDGTLTIVSNSASSTDNDLDLVDDAR